ncbi:MAG: M24 family metallopeptidase [Candidatus Micrarchaeota archaeon]|nr:M24 family metallopeptidase [Candidatus Micrarchaeota archaeon]
MDYLIPSSTHLKYFTGLDIENIVMFRDTIYTYDLNRKLVEHRYRGKVENMDRLFQDIRGKDIAAPLRDMNARLYLKISKHANRIEDCTDEFYSIRMRKDGNELKKISKASREALRIMDRLVSRLDSTMTEREVEEELMRMIIPRESAFRPIIASIRNARFSHYQSRGIRIGRGVLIDFGIVYRGYRSDITETVLLQDDPKLETKYRLLRSIFKEIVDSIRPGMLASDLDRVFRRAYRRNNLNLPPHSIGHGIGMDVHEYPILSKDSNHVLLDTAITIEPGYYTSSYGMRYERDVLIYSDGVEVLDI